MTQPKPCPALDAFLEERAEFRRIVRPHVEKTLAAVPIDPRTAENVRNILDFEARWNREPHRDPMDILGEMISPLTR